MPRKTTKLRDDNKAWKTAKIRADPKTWNNVRELLPDYTDRDRIKILYNTSALRIEKALVEMDFKDKLGEFLYGKKIWKKQKR